MRIVHILSLLSFYSLSSAVITTRNSTDRNALLTSTSTPTTSPDLFKQNCVDPNHGEIGCRVERVDCSTEPASKATHNDAPEAHDVRMDAVAKVLTKTQQHQLHVDISWQIQSQNMSSQSHAFLMQIDAREKDEEAPMCFRLVVTNLSLNSESSPRFHFSSDSLFNFSQQYDVAMHGLPRNSRDPVTVTRRMPSNPDVVEHADVLNWTEACKNKSHPEAYRWTAGFKKIFLQSIARAIKIEFTAAPPQYCFEKYEVKLMDESGITLLRSVEIDESSLKTEWIGERFIRFGEYTFSDLELNTSYVPAVAPVETASDGRCLCPASEGHGTCSCINAIFKKQILGRIEQPEHNKKPPVEIPAIALTTKSDSWLWYLSLAMLALVALSCLLLLCFFSVYRNFRRRGKTVRIWFNNGGISHHPLEPQAPLIYNQKPSILIVYSHDHPLHEATVIAFAQLLRDTFNMTVHLDVWDVEEMERNVTEYVNASIVRADKVVVINSAGAYMRMRARHLKEGAVERINAGPHDTLFIRQIDLALQHARVISVRFSYTPSSHTLFALSPLLQYTVPENMNLLTTSLTSSSSLDPRLGGFTPELARLHAAVTRMANFIESEPQWFEKSHHRLARMSLTNGLIPTSDVRDDIRTSSVVAANGDVVKSTTPRSTPPSVLPMAIVNPSPANVFAPAREELVQPLIERNQDVHIEMVPATEFDGDSGRYGDSAYCSGVVFERSGPMEEVLDKPRSIAKSHRNSIIADSGIHDDSAVIN